MCFDCGAAHCLQLGLFINKVCQTLSQVVQVANFDIEGLEEMPDLHLGRLLFFPAGGQRLFGALDLTLQLGVSSLKFLQRNGQTLLVNSFDFFVRDCRNGLRYSPL